MKVYKKKQKRKIVLLKNEGKKKSKEKCQQCLPDRSLLRPSTRQICRSKRSFHEVGRRRLPLRNWEHEVKFFARRATWSAFLICRLPSPARFVAVSNGEFRVFGGAIWSRPSIRRVSFNFFSFFCLRFTSRRVVPKPQVTAAVFEML